MTNYKQISIDMRGRSRYLFTDEMFLYSVTNSRGSKQYLKCIGSLKEEQPRVQCSCKAIIEFGVIKRTNSEQHRHGTHKHFAEYSTAYNELKHAAFLDTGNLKDLFQKHFDSLSREASKFVCWREVQSTLRRLRGCKMPVCRSLDDLVRHLEDDNSLPFQLYGTLYGESIYQGAVDDQVIFANLELIRQLDLEVDIYADATFSITPFRSSQLFIVLAELQGKPRPVIYVIMTGKSQRKYEAVFYFMRVVLLRFDGQPRVVKALMSDFECALRRAFSATWPQASVSGCNFHFAQALRRKAKTFPRLGNKITGQTVHHTILIMFMRLSFIPYERIDEGLEVLISYIEERGVEHDFHEFVDYFRRIWMRRFPALEWCVSNRARRTNNHVEGYHRHVKDEININPSPWDFLQGLKQLLKDAISQHDSDVRKRRTEFPDRSRYSVQLADALVRLNAGELDLQSFLLELSGCRDFPDGDDDEF